MNEDKKPVVVAGEGQGVAEVKSPFIERAEPLSQQVIFVGNILAALERAGLTQSHLALLSQDRVAADEVKLTLDRLLNFNRAELVAIQQALYLFKSELETGGFTYLWTTADLGSLLDLIVSEVWSKRIGFDLRLQNKTGLNSEVRELCVSLEYFILLYTLYSLAKLCKRETEKPLTPNMIIEAVRYMSYEKFWTLSRCARFLTLKQYRCFNQKYSSVSAVLTFMNFGDGILGTSKPDFSALKLNLHAILTEHMKWMFGMVATRLDRLEAVKK